MAIDRSERGGGQMATLVPGLHVVTHDGQQIGTLKEVDGDFFKVDAPLQRDYWLRRSEIETRETDEIVVSFERDALDEHKLEQPAMEAGTDPAPDPTIAPAISSEELLDQRARMERELAEQSKRLPSMAPSITETRATRNEEQIPKDHTGFGELAGETVPYAPALDEQQGRPATGDDLLAATPVPPSPKLETAAPLAAPVAVGHNAGGNGAVASRASQLIEQIESESGKADSFETIDAGSIDASKMPKNPLAGSQPDTGGRIEPATNGAARDPSAHPTTGEVAFPAGAGRSAPYGPVSQQPSAPPIVHEPLHRYDSGAEPEASMLSRVAGVVAHPVVVAGVIATVAYTVPMYVARRSGASKLDFPLLLGSVLRKPDGKARAIGLVPQTLASVIALPAAYRASFGMLGIRPSAKAGVLMAVPHIVASSVATVALDKLHPRALGHGSPELLERFDHVKAPGLAGRRYGWLTPLSFIAGHLAYGAIIGWWLGKSAPQHEDALLGDTPEGSM